MRMKRENVITHGLKRTHAIMISMSVIIVYTLDDIYDHPAACGIVANVLCCGWNF